MKTPILGGASVARSVNAAAARMVNLYPEAIPEGGKEPAYLSRAPGVRLLATVGTGPIRGLWAYGGVGYVVSGTTLYSLGPNWQISTLGDVSGTGPVSMADNGTQLFVACNGPSYIYNNTTFAFVQITDPDFPGAVTVSYLDGYFVFNEPNSQRIWVTSLLEGTEIDALDFASAEGSPDGVLSVIVDHRELWVFGTTSVEVWYNAGLADFPLQRIQGAFIEIGCAAAFSVANLDNGLFWLGSDARGQGIVYRANGYTGTRVSTHTVEWQIQQYTDISDAIGYTYQQDGHSFYVLIFPSADTTWVYDVSTQVWHERAGFVNGNFTRHRSNCQMSFNDEIVVGDYSNGNVYAFDMTMYLDEHSTQKWLRSWRALAAGQNDLKRAAHHMLQLDCETGVGTIAGSELTFARLLLEPPLEAGGLLLEDGRDILISGGSTGSRYVGLQPQVMLRWSDDGGHTWSNERWAGMGTGGQYGSRVIWRRLGMTTKLRDRVYEVSGTDPVKIAIMGAELTASKTDA